MVKCNRGCGAEDLRWKVVNGSYKLLNYNDLLHICNDGTQAGKSAQEKATASILHELGLSEPADIPEAEAYVPKKKNGLPDGHTLPRMKTLWDAASKDPKKMFTISRTATGIAITGDDKHNAIYLPKVSICELVKALVDFI